MAFRVGQEVVCIKRGEWRFEKTLEIAEGGPVYGEVCVIEYIDEDGDIRLQGYPRGFYLRNWFRPVQKRKTSIECFTALLNTKSVEELV